MKNAGEELANPTKFPYLYDPQNPRDVFLKDLEALIENHKIHWVRSGFTFRKHEHVPCFSSNHNDLKLTLFYVVRNFELKPVHEIGDDSVRVEGDLVERISRLVREGFSGRMTESIKYAERQVWLGLCGKLGR